MMNIRTSTAFVDVSSVSGSARARPWALRRSVSHLGKRVFDVLTVITLTPVAMMTALVLLVLNPLANPGPLFFVQKRMGQGCRPIRIVKFRTMAVQRRVRRRADDRLDVDRITPLGRHLRRLRIDELPQLINVARGEMSIVGPRPDYFPHALYYIHAVPEYRARHAVRPGITGLAQIELGYAEGTEATRAKAAMDLRYIRERGLRLDAHILFRTLRVVAIGGGR